MGYLQHMLAGAVVEYTPIQPMRAPRRKAATQPSLFDENEVDDEPYQYLPDVYLMRKALRHGFIPALYIWEATGGTAHISTGCIGDFWMGLPGVEIYQIPIFLAGQMVNIAPTWGQRLRERVWLQLNIDYPQQELEAAITLWLTDDVLRQEAESLQETLRLWEVADLQKSRYHTQVVNHLKSLRDVLYQLKPKKPTVQKDIEITTRFIGKYQGFLDVLNHRFDKDLNAFAFGILSLQAGPENIDRQLRTYDPGGKYFQPFAKALKTRQKLFEAKTLPDGEGTAIVAQSALAEMLHTFTGALLPRITLNKLPIAYSVG